MRTKVPSHSSDPGVGCSYWRTGYAHPPLRLAAAAPPSHRRPAALQQQRRRLSTAARASSSSAAAASEGGSNGSDPSPPPPGSLREEARRSNEEVYDRLADVFTERKPEEWRKLIAYSKQWPLLAEGVLNRLEERAAAADDEEQQRATRRVARRLRTVSEEVSHHAELVEKFRAAPSREWESMVTRHRPALGADLFGFLELRIRASASKAAGDGRHDSREAEALAALAAQVAALVEAHDRVVQDETALEAAGGRFASLLAAESMEAAEAQIDALAGAGKLDPALLLTMARAYAGVKETDKTKEEVKDIMAHLYFKAKESFAAQAPPEARILKFLLSVDDPGQRAALLEQAFQSGADLSTSSEDYLHTSPPVLLNTIENVLAVYEGGRGGGTMAGQAAELMNPEVIQRMRELRQLIRKRFM